HLGWALPLPSDTQEKIRGKMPGECFPASSRLHQRPRDTSSWSMWPVAKKRTTRRSFALGIAHAGVRGHDFVAHILRIELQSWPIAQRREARLRESPRCCLLRRQGQVSVR
ncbi:unnamed protein product, partial [Ectocarpus sp. 13 AM-2016]